MDMRRLKRQLGIAEESTRIKKERLEEGERFYDEEHSTFTSFSKRLEEKWEQRFDALAALARDAGVLEESIEEVRQREWQPPTSSSAEASEPWRSRERRSTMARAQPPPFDFPIHQCEVTSEHPHASSF